jgi:regulator of protease activity HflC (stomatin/prohibitin superfamily)
MDQEDADVIKILLLCALVLFMMVGGGCLAWPWYHVYSSTQAGRARLAEATSSRQIAVLEAKAKMDAAHDLAAAEVERAKGVAQANKIIGDSLHGNEGYLRYLWIQALQDSSREVIYVPTEANLPILEARTPAVKP